MCSNEAAQSAFKATVVGKKILLISSDMIRSIFFHESLKKYVCWNAIMKLIIL